MRFWVCCALTASMLTTPSFALGRRVDEGMWPFNQTPKEEVKKRYGFEISDAWLQRVRMASVRFDTGGSGSFVSPDGLVMTNHHVALDTLQKMSSPQERKKGRRVCPSTCWPESRM